MLQAGRLGCRSLILSQNTLEALPPGLGALATITSLSCSENKLVELPDELLLLAGALTHLDARSSLLRSFRRHCASLLSPPPPKAAA